MFTGLIEQIGTVLSIKNKSKEAGMITVCHDQWDPPLREGESIAVQGCCLTIHNLKGKSFSCHILRETFKMTTLGSLEKGTLLNLERSLRMGDRIGGI